MKIFAPIQEAVKPIQEAVKQQKPLPREALETLDSVINSYDRLATDAPKRDPGDDLIIDRLRDRRKNDAAGIWWSDIAIAEQCAADLLPKEQLPARLASWRRRLQEVAGRDRYATYLATATTPTETDEGKLRADLDECMRAVYYFYSSYGIAALSRNKVTESLFRTASIIIAAELFILWLFYVAPAAAVPQQTFDFIEWVVATSIAGTLGSVVSVQRRLQDPSTSSVDPLYRYITTTADWFGTAVVSPISGAIFGLLMYALLASKLLAGTLIHFNAPPDNATAQQIASTFLTPKTQVDGAILLVLGFISGFAEQLIPDALTRIASRALGGGEADTTTAAPLTAPSQQVTPTNGVTTAQTVSPNGKAAAGTSTNSKPTVLNGTPALTPEAAARGQDPTLASEASVNAEGS